MPDIQSISPLLDGFRLGDNISDHGGIVCCPAIREKNNQQYIVKVICLPATQQQMDALLLAGAYKNPEDAVGYFRQQGEDIMREAELLKKLSSLEGFVSYSNWQMVPIPKRRLGFLVYLAGEYRVALDKHLKQHPVTHLEALNLGLDLCAALSVCRHAGSLYVNLKPSNVFVSDKKEYRIGDLGFLALDALSYTVIPDRYRSSYTPPELYDPMAPMNLTVDTYAVGMMLYQLYNDGQLPFRGAPPTEELPAPVNADYELAAVILRAINPDPEKRFTDPKGLGQELTAYMQRNTVNDAPISVASPIISGLDEPIVVQTNSSEAATLSDGSETASTEDESAPGEADADSLLPHEMSDELSKIVAKADDLIAMEPPPAVVVPEVPKEEDPFAFATAGEEKLDDSDVPYDPVIPEPKKPEEKKKKERRFISPEIKRRKKRILHRLAALLVIAMVAFAGYWYYQLIFLQNVRAITMETGVRELSVHVDSEIPDSKLQVICSDSFGNSFNQPVYDGFALFANLQPNTTYQISLEMEGFHHLTGETSAIITTNTTTEILVFGATAGVENGSVVLEFIPDGEEPEKWTLMTAAKGENGQISTFSGHSFTVSGLDVGKTYTFTLGTGNGLSLSGETSLEYLVPRLILAQNITFSSENPSTLNVSWQAPGDLALDQWTVRCYNNDGFDQTVTATQTQAKFTGVDFTTGYSVEVKAAGMSLPAQASIPADPISVSGIQFLNQDDVASNSLSVSWDSEGKIPEGGWLLSCSVDGISVVESAACNENTAQIPLRIPGARYQIRLDAASGDSILNSTHNLVYPAAEPLNFNLLTADALEGFLLKTPAETNWSYDTASPVEDFAPSDSISVVLHTDSDFYTPGTPVEILYVIRDSQGNAIPYLCDQVSTYWNQIWSKRNLHYGQLTLPYSPATRGSYSVDIYVNGQHVIALPFTVS